MSSYYGCGSFITKRKSHNFGHLVESEARRSGHIVSQQAQLFLCEPQLLFRLLPLSDIHARADVAGKNAVRTKERNPLVKYPTILTIPAPEAILHLEFFSRVKGGNVSIEASLEVFVVNAFGPAVSELLLHCSPGKVKPALIEKCTKLICPGG